MLVGRTPLGPLKMRNSEPIAGAATCEQLYAGQLVTVGDATYLLGSVWPDEEPEFVCDPVPVRRARTG